jgi:3-oxoacyl-[acyl-carrier-protein] synthase II
MKCSEAVRVVITGTGVISPLGCNASDLIAGLRNGSSGVTDFSRIPKGALSVDYGAEVKSFSGAIEDYGALDKQLQKSIRKGSKLMCREIEMGVAAAQLAISDSGLVPEVRQSHRTGVVFGCDYIMTLPDEFASGISNCLGEGGDFVFKDWATKGLPHVNPLWLLKYLPNMPASHVAIYNDFRGPNNSITLREASPAAALWEAYSTLCRGHADVLVVGATGSRIQPFRSMHASMQEMLARIDGEGDLADMKRVSRPFASDRRGCVLGEGAAALILETERHAEGRGARVIGEVLGGGSSAVSPNFGSGYLRLSLVNAIRMATRGRDLSGIGHVNAHGLGTLISDQEEASAIAEVFSDDKPGIPVTSVKGHIGNLGAGGGMVEIVASIQALGGELFPTLNCENPDRACPVNVVNKRGVEAGDSFVSVNVTPQGQASAIHIKRK